MASAVAVPTDVTDTEYAICAYRKLRGADLPGATGVVRKVTKRDGTAFYVKRMVFQAEVEGEEEGKAANFLKPGVTESQVYNELDINEALSEALPDVVSRMIGSTIFREGDTRVAYLVFEGLEGMDALKYMRTLPSDAEIAEIVACVREKVAKLHEAQYVHSDLQGPNIFLMTNEAGRFTDCRLIDFGGARYVGDESGGRRRHFYDFDLTMVDRLEEQLKKMRDKHSKKSSSHGGYRRTRRRQQQQRHRGTKRRST